MPGIHYTDPGDEEDERKLLKNTQIPPCQTITEPATIRPAASNALEINDLRRSEGENVLFINEHRDQEYPD